MPTPPDILSPAAAYRYQERLSVLCGSDGATEEQHSLALLEALQYEKEREKP